jgi:two-component system, chemotaxis family, sensor kinase CheA
MVLGMAPGTAGRGPTRGHSMTFEDELLGEFLIESYESLDQLDQDFVRLETDRSPDALAGIFRAVHTIKGSSGFLALGRLEGLAHVGENLLASVREGKIELTSDMVSALLAMIDVIREMLASIEANGSEGDVDETTVKEQLATLLRGDAPAPAPKAAPRARAKAASSATGPAEPGAGADEGPIIERVGGVNGISLVVAKLFDLLGDDPRTTEHFAHGGAHHRIHLVTWFTTALGGPDVYRGKDMPTAHAKFSLTPEHLEAFCEHLRTAFATSGCPVSDLDAIEAIARAAGVLDAPPAVAPKAEVAPAAAPAAVTTAKAAPAGSPAAESADGARGGVADSTIRVDVALLDTLMNLVGELVLARNQVLQYTNVLEGAGANGTTQRLNMITSELQESVMKTRMQPIGTTWAKVPRVMRDIAVGLGKQIRVEMEGADTELDKSIVEAIKDPMTHLVRNAGDHGLEAPDVRTAAGKPAEGVLTLRAFHEGGQVVIEIADDGAGIDPARVKAKAVEQGLITAEQAARMGDREAWHLIFAPGFSTAAEVTNISGRGVGMDVVRTNIERIGGHIDVASVLGAGTTIRIKIPLTLAIIPALLVTTAGERFAIPQINLLELVRVDAAKGSEAGIEHVHGVPVYRLRGDLLPLVHLDRHLGIAHRGGEREEARNVVVLQADGRRFGLVVDEINDTEEIVVKPLGHLLKGVDAFAGATILGDGRIALIVDVLRTAQRADIVGERHDRDGAAASAAAVDDTNLAAMLVLAAGGHRVAIPMAMVTRLEEFPASAFEWGAGQEVVQYRGDIMPVVRVPGTAGPADDDPEALVPVIVATRNGNVVGIVADEIVDIVETDLEIRPAVGYHEVIVGSAVIGGKVTDVVDLEAVIRSVDPLFFDRTERARVMLANVPVEV